MNIRKFLSVFVVVLLFLPSQVFSQVTDDNKEKNQPPAVKKSVEDIKSPPKPTRPRRQSRKPRKEPEVPLTDARITFDHTIYDFGIIAPGSRVVHYFNVSNTGPDTLVITKIKPN